MRIADMYEDQFREEVALQQKRERQKFIDDSMKLNAAILLSQHGIQPYPRWDLQEIAEHAVRMAEALADERERNEGSER